MLDQYGDVQAILNSAPDKLRKEEGHDSPALAFFKYWTSEGYSLLVVDRKAQSEILRAVYPEWA